MAVIFNIDHRRVIPRLRSFENSMKTGELDLISGTEHKKLYNSGEILREQKHSWQKNRNLTYAGDLLSSAFVLGVESEFEDVAKYILDKQEFVNNSLVNIARKTLGIKEDYSFEEQHGSAVFDENILRSDIRKLKQTIKQEPRNPIALLEVGRIYSLLAQIDKAKKYFDMSLSLDKSNRFLVRSASRFYHHFLRDSDTALRIIKGSQFANDDPWLLSADVAYSNILNRHSKMMKRGKSILDSQQFNASSITELASAVGTVELSNGKNKDAKKYFVQSLKQPNDNSLAQAEWVSDSINGLYIDKSNFNLPLASEAKMLAYYEKKLYPQALENAIDWMHDEAYSTRPVLVASFISGSLMHNYQQSIGLLRQGLKINATNKILYNNLVYYMVLNGQVDEAAKIFKDHLNQSSDNIKLDSDGTLITATAGLLSYRTGHPIEGKQLYLKAIQMAEKLQKESLVQSACANLLREEILISGNKTEIEMLIARIKKLNGVNPLDDITILLDQCIEMYNAKLKSK